MTTTVRRPLSDPIAADRDLGQQIGMLEIEIRLRVADLHADNERIARLRKTLQRKINERLDLIPEVQDVEMLRTRSRANRGMGR